MKKGLVIFVILLRKIGATLAFYSGCGQTGSTATTTSTTTTDSSTSSTASSTTTSSTVSTTTTTATTTTTTLSWSRCRGGSNQDNGYDIQQTSDGGYVVIGYSDSNTGDVSGNHGLEDFWLVKLLNTGLIDWQKSLGGSGSDKAQSIRQISDGGYVAAGATSTSANDGDVSGFKGGAYDYWIIKR